jgi:hypothetical protein
LTVDDLFADPRLQFFLRNRADIKAWAAIETDVIAATRELLARSQVGLEQRLVTVDPTVIVGRRDNSQWERIVARHELWPESVGLCLEWNRSVDLLGTNRPKMGVFWWADPASLVEPRSRFVASVDATRLQELDYKVPLEGVWPVGARTKAPADWWLDPEAWINDVIERLATTWPLVAPHVDVVLA